MAKVTLNIGFYLENQHYAQMEAYLPRIQAIKIPQLRIQEKGARSTQNQGNNKKGGKKTGKFQISRSQISQSKKNQSEQQLNQEEDQNPNEMENQQDDQPQEQEPIVQDEVLASEKIDSQKDQQNILQYLQDDDDSQDDDLDEDDDLSSISRSMSVLKNTPKTKRQKGERGGLMQLPDRRPRKDKQLDQATEIIRREEKQRKRKQYLKKQVQAQQKATLDKILNETGRKLKLKQEKEKQDQTRRDDRQFKNLGNVPKIITIEGRSGRTILTHNTNLFSDEMTRVPEVRIKPQCSKCGTNEGKYKIKNSNNIACSLNCYKLLTSS